ncbi:MAG: hypothetical protein HQL55_03255 [Magnetococcales bacterium]|nr:hypothetical protein [Magnetococcales bacterium]
MSRFYGIAIPMKIVLIGIVWVFFFLAVISGYLVNVRNLPGDSYKGYSDALTHIAQAMAMAHPGSFAGDYTLSDSKGHFFNNFLVFYLETMGSFFPSFSHAHFFLGVPMTFFHLSGFYLLGRILGGRAEWGILLSFASFATINLPVEYWAFHLYPRSLGLFTALLPFFLLLFVRFIHQPARWPWLFMLLGASSFVHQISVPFVGFALWCSLFAFRPPNWRWIPFLGMLTLVGLAFLAGMIPFEIKIIMDSMASGEEAVNYQDAMAAFTFLYGKNVPVYLQPWGVIKQTVLAILTTPGLIVTLLIGMAGVIANLLGYLGERRFGVGMVLLSLGLVFVSGAVPLAERYWMDMHEKLPVLKDGPRNLVYLLPIMLVSAFVTIHRLGERYTRPHLALLVAALLTGAWWSAGIHQGQIYPIANMGEYTQCLKELHLVCLPREDNEIDFVKALQQRIPYKGRIFAYGHTYRLKVMLHRPMVFSKKDVQLQYYISKKKMVEGFRLLQRIQLVENNPDPFQQIAGVKQIATELGAEYFIISRHVWDRVQNHQDKLNALFGEPLYHDNLGALYRIGAS